MRVTISLMGRFHAFNLAHELERQGHLERLITSYPRFETVKYGISREHICSLLLNEILNRGWRRAPDWLKAHYNAQYLLHELFDRRAARHLPPQPELVVGWSAYSLHTLRRARELGARTVLDHGSCHIVAQDEILREEYSRLGWRGREFAHPKIIDKELQEYREAEAIVLPSQFSRETFVSRGVPAAKLLLAPYGVNLTNFYPVGKAGQNLPGHPLRPDQLAQGGPLSAAGLYGTAAAGGGIMAHRQPHRGVPPLAAAVRLSQHPASGALPGAGAA